MTTTSLGRGGGAGANGAVGERESVDVGELASEVVTLLEREARAKNVTLVLDADPETPRVQAVRDHLHQVFLNLLLNAVEASDDGKRIEVQLSSTEGHVVIAVADRGVGIAPEDLQRVYDPLYTTRRDGSGLGLTIARRLVIAHSGHIEIESEVGAGTVVRVLLPSVIDPDEGLTREAATASPNVAAPGSTHRNAT